MEKRTGLLLSTLLMLAVEGHFPKYWHWHINIIAGTAIINSATLISADDVFLKIHNLQFQLIKP